jgi:23S rRNA G2445 N2-methylase RlmL
MKGRNPAKELYQRLRLLSCEQLWSTEVPAFDRAGARERMETVAVVRAVGVVFSEQGTPEQMGAARQWLRGLLDDPEEKIRRYAMNALPKIGADAVEESALHSVLRRTASDRERQSVGRALEKIGGEATLEMTGSGDFEALDRTVAKVQANVARQQTPSRILLDRPLKNTAKLRINLRGRSGLEQIIEDEVRDRAGDSFRVIQTMPGVVTVAPSGAITLDDLYELRCFATVGFVLGSFQGIDPDADVEALAAIVASPTTRGILEAFTEGPLRYRLEFASKGHQRGMVRRVADRVYALCPRLLNDSREAPWQVEVHHTRSGVVAELTPRLKPDPRFAYRRRDVPAASHPPLAACMARLAGRLNDEVIWDPFCGSGLELIETTLRSNVRHVIGTDRSAEAIAITEANFAAAIDRPPKTTFAACDFRDYRRVEGLERNSVSLIITNPPLGRRVPIRNLGELMSGLFEAAGALLRPGGRLVFVNPLSVKPANDSLKLESRRNVDLGGFTCQLEKYVKSASR